MKDPRTLSARDLKLWIATRFGLHGDRIAAVDIRQGEEPYDLPLNLWRSAGTAFHHRFLRAVLALLEEAADNPWKPDSFNQLMRLIEAGRIGEAVHVLESLTSSRALLRTQEGRPLHMQALRTLLALGWNGSVEFWTAQCSIIGQQWPAIIFKGLARHDLEKAFSALPTLAVDRTTLRQILDIFPGILRTNNVTLSDLHACGRQIEAQLLPECVAILREWFALRGFREHYRSLPIHPGLTHALKLLLQDEAKPLTYQAALLAAA